MTRAALLGLALFVAACGSSHSSSTPDGAPPGDGACAGALCPDAQADGLQPDTDAGVDAPPVDPCVGAVTDGWYCSASLGSPGDDPATLYRCVAQGTASRSLCAKGCHVARPGAQDVCTPAGKGVWVWTFDTHAGAPADVAQKCQDMGVGFVLIKCGEDTSYWSTEFTADVVAEFTSRGITVYGWPYLRPGNLTPKIDAVAQAASVPGVSGIILDVEVEFVGYDSDAAALCDGIRAAVPGVFLGYTSFGWVAYHTDFPFAAFDQHCGDAFLPQSYWDGWTITPTQAYDKAVQGAADLGLTAPIWAIQDNASHPTTAGLNEFFGVAGPFSSLWRWPDPTDQTSFDQLSQLDWAN